MLNLALQPAYRHLLFSLKQSENKGNKDVLVGATALKKTEDKIQF